MVATNRGWVHGLGLVVRYLRHDMCPILILKRWERERLSCDCMIAPFSFTLTYFHDGFVYCSGSSVRASQPFPLMDTLTGCFSLSQSGKQWSLSVGCWFLRMSYLTDLFSSSPTKSTGNDDGTDPAATAPGTASHAGDHCPAPPQATISPSSLDDIYGTGPSKAMV